MSTINKNPAYFAGVIGNYSLKAKKIFLSFMQSWFSTYESIEPRFYWRSDFTNTPLIILDKFSYNTGHMDPRPAIILSRGPMQLMQTCINQLASFNMETNNKTYTDLIRTSVTLTCISQNGLEAEELANIVSNALTSFKEEFRRAGVHQIHNINVGEETRLHNREREVFVAVPIQVDFSMQIGLEKMPKQNKIVVSYTANHLPEDQDINNVWSYIEGQNTVGGWVDTGTEQEFTVTLVETEDYEVNSSGLLEFTTAPVPEYFMVSGLVSTTGPDDGTEPKPGQSASFKTRGYVPNGTVTWSVTYTNATTLDETIATLDVDGIETEFALPGGIYGYYVLADVIFDLTTTNEASFD